MSDVNTVKENWRMLHDVAVDFRWRVIRNLCDPHIGLCLQLHSELDRRMRVEQRHLHRRDSWTAYINLCIRSWPEGDGRNMSFPVPHPYMRNEEAYYDSMHLYRGEYGAARMRLLDHIIEQSRQLVE